MLPSPLMHKQFEVKSSWLIAVLMCFFIIRLLWEYHAESIEKLLPTWIYAKCQIHFGSSQEFSLWRTMVTCSEYAVNFGHELWVLRLMSRFLSPTWTLQKDLILTKDHTWGCQIVVKWQQRICNQQVLRIQVTWPAYYELKLTIQLMIKATNMTMQGELFWFWSPPVSQMHTEAKHMVDLQVH
jgi:hypothetical protein